MGAYCAPLVADLFLLCLTLIVFLMSCSCYCSVALSHSAVGWYVMCDCVIS